MIIIRLSAKSDDNDYNCEKRSSHTSIKLLLIMRFEDVTAINVDKIHLELTFPKKIVIPNILIPSTGTRIDLKRLLERSAPC